MRPFLTMDDVREDPLPRSVRESIGGIFVVGAMIDHLVAMSLFKLTDMPPTNGFVFLQRMMMGEKLKRLQFFIKASQEPALIDALTELQQKLEKFTPTRNVLAHGVYLGVKNDTGQYCFYNTADHSAGEGLKFLTQIAAMSAGHLRNTIDLGDEIVSLLATRLGARPLHVEHPMRSMEQTDLDPEAPPENGRE